MAKKKIPVLSKLPDGNYIRTEKSFKTVYIQNPKSGRMKGRKKVRGYGDKTAIRRVEKDFILVKKSKRARGHIRKRYYKGQIIGRVPIIKIKRRKTSS